MLIQKYFTKPVGILAVLLPLVMAQYSNDTRSPPLYDIWQSYAPGQLLATLDDLSAYGGDALPIQEPLLLENPQSLTSTPPTTLQPQPVIQKRIELPPQIEERNVYSTEDHLDSEENEDAYDYDRAYDKFVQKYFDTKVSEASEDSGSHESAESAEGYSLEETDDSVELEEPLSEAASNKSPPKEQCKKVRKHRQVCEICKNEKTGEKSESCSYSTGSKPKTYSYDKGKSYKIKRGGGVSSEAKDSDAEDSKSESREEVKKKKKVNRRKAKKRKLPFARKAATSKSHSFCIRKMRGNQVCYYCADGSGDRAVECQSLAASMPTQNLRTIGAAPNPQNVHDHRQRLYKRMTSYSYEKNDDGGKPDAGNINTNVTTPEATNANAPLKRKVIVKYMKRITN